MHFLLILKTILRCRVAHTGTRTHRRSISMNYIISIDSRPTDSSTFTCSKRIWYTHTNTHKHTHTHGHLQCILILRVTGNVTSALNNFPYLKAFSALPTDPQNDPALPTLPPFLSSLMHFNTACDNKCYIRTK